MTSAQHHGPPEPGQTVRVLIEDVEDATDMGEESRGMLLAAVIALPIAAVAIARYLAPFTERTPYAYVALAVALFAAAMVVTVAAARQGWLAMQMRPAAALGN